MFFKLTPEMEKQYEEKYGIDVDKLAEEALDIGRNTDASVFPQFLFNIQLNRFDNDFYLQRGSCTNPYIQEAYTLARTYADFWDYMDAMNIYQEYVQWIEETYGPFDAILEASREGAIGVYMPEEPTPKKKKKIMRMLSTGFIPSRIYEDEYQEEAIEEIMKNLPERERVKEEDDDEKIPKKVLRLNDLALQSQITKDRVAGMYSVNGQYRTHNTDAIIAFLNSANTTEMQSRGGIGNSFTDEIRALHEFDGMSEEEIEEAIMPKGMIIDAGLPVRYDESRRIKEIINILNANGWDFTEEHNLVGMNSRDKKVIRKARIKEVDESKLTKKERKLLKKERKKDKKKEADRELDAISNARLGAMLLANRFSSSQANADGSINFRFSDVFPTE